MSLKPIPLRDPEVIAAEAKERWHGNDEKVPTTTLKGLTVRGIELSSRYQKADEYEEMQRVVALLPYRAAGAVGSMFCDSTATHTYEVVLRFDAAHWNADVAKYCIGKCLDAALVLVVGGHNGIMIRAAGNHYDDPYVDICPDWPC
jgi:hypothetical protein